MLDACTCLNERKLAADNAARPTKNYGTADCNCGDQSLRQKPDGLLADLLANEQAPLDLRFQAAKELAPFVHPKLASTESRSGGMSHEDRLAELEKLLEDD
jgi:hypothetical protein